MCDATDMRQIYRVFQALSKLSEITIEHYRRSDTYFDINRYWEMDPHQITLTYPQTIYGTFPEPFRNHSPKPTKNLIPNTIRNTYGHSQYFGDNSCTATCFLLIFTHAKDGYSN